MSGSPAVVELVRYLSPKAAQCVFAALACACQTPACWCTTEPPLPPTHSKVAPVFVFSESLDNAPKKIWEAVSHEVGHSFGLS